MANYADLEFAGLDLDYYICRGNQPLGSEWNLSKMGTCTARKYVLTTNGTAVHNRAKRIMQAEGREDKLYACRLVRSREKA